MPALLLMSFGILIIGITKTLLVVPLLIALFK